MRFLLTLLLVFVIPFNAACAAGVGVLDVLEGGAPHGEHPGYYAHAHAHDDGQDVTPDPAQSGGDRCHSHEHPVFSWALPAVIDFLPPSDRAVVLPLPPDRFFSAIPTRLDRPPRAVLVA